ncbi:MAG: DUF4037 domain-containing protein [Candidatus Latescibacteria bacterium]|nr:DUF4037 domain-containing protein [Candidatus Latescibacterota bacterium]
MNEASLWRFEIAQKIAFVFAQTPGVEAIQLGGSAAHGWADPYSDTELGVFWRELPTVHQQMAMLAKVKGRPRFGKIYPFRHPDPYEPGGGYSPFLVGRAPEGNAGIDYPASESGYPIEMEQDTVAGAEQCLVDVIDNFDASVRRQGLLAFIQTGIPLHGKALIEKWRQKIAVYPDELATKIIHSKLKSLRWKLWQQEVWVARNDVLALYREMVEIERDLVELLLALNRVYYRADIKWIDRAIQPLPIKPAELSARLKQGFQMQPSQGLEHLRQLTAETLDLVAEHSPGIDASVLETTLSPCWRTWENPPEDWQVE